MKQIFFSAMLIAICISSFGQDDSAQKIKKHVPNLATIHTTEGKTLKGWFYKMDDNQIILLPSKTKKLSVAYLAKTNENTINLGVEQIRSISLRKKNSILKGALIGLGVGVLTGTVIGLVSGNDPVEPYYSSNQDPYGVGNFFVSLNNSFAMTAGEKATVGAIGLGTSGAIIGIIIGAIAKKKFIIGGKKEVYHDLQDDLMKR